MDIETQPTEIPTPPTGAPAPEPAPAPAPAAAGSGVPTPEPAQAPEPAPAPAPTSRVIQIPTAKMAQIKNAERDRGRTEALQTANLAAKERGFESYDHMMTQVGNYPQPTTDPGTPTPPEPAGEPEPQQPRKLAKALRENARLLEERRVLNQSRAHEERKRKSLETQLSAQQAEHELRFSAHKAGVQDVDYALTLLQRELKTQTPEQLENFDEGKFFSTTMRKSHPYLYNPETRGAHSSPGPDDVGGAGTPPPASTGNSPATPSARPKAGDLTQDQYTARLKELGITPPSVGMPA